MALKQLASGAHVMIVEDIAEVNYENIMKHISNFQKENV